MDLVNLLFKKSTCIDCVSVEGLHFSKCASFIFQGSLKGAIHFPGNQMGQSSGSLDAVTLLLANLSNFVVILEYL